MCVSCDSDGVFVHNSDCDSAGNFNHSGSLDPVVQFIEERFPIDCDWMTGNCFHFATILYSTFVTYYHHEGEIVYDRILGHFAFHDFYTNHFYDWRGIADDRLNLAATVEFTSYNEEDPLHYNHIVRDCIL